MYELNDDVISGWPLRAEEKRCKVSLENSARVSLSIFHSHEPHSFMIISLTR